MKKIFFANSDDGGHIARNARQMMMHLSISIDEDVQQTLSFFQKVSCLLESGWLMGLIYCACLGVCGTDVCSLSLSYTYPKVCGTKLLQLYLDILPHLLL